MHIMELAMIAVVVLALFGAKTLQSVAHSAGKTVAQTKQVKKSVMSDLGVDDLKKASESLPRIPLNPQQAVKQYMLNNTNEKVSVSTSKHSNPDTEE